MSKKYPSYAAEYRQQMVELIRGGTHARGAGSRVRVLGFSDTQLGAASGSGRRVFVRMV